MPKRHFQQEFDKLREAFPGHFGPNRDPKDGQYHLRPRTISVSTGRSSRLLPKGTILVALDDPKDKDRIREIEKELEENPETEGEGEEATGDDERDFGGFPGGITRQTVTNAFYLPFHFYFNWWGIYIFPDGVRRTNAKLRKWFNALNVTNAERVQIGRDYLLHHEYYHHRCESFATRLEAILNRPCYTSFSARYNQVGLTSLCHEEACAESFAREELVRRYGGADKGRVRAWIDEKIAAGLPGYREGAGSGDTWERKLRPRLFEDYLATIPALKERGSLMSKEYQAWHMAGYLDEGIAMRNSRIAYIIRPGDPLYKRVSI
jgi:hypothetical protein